MHIKDVRVGASRVMHTSRGRDPHDRLVRSRLHSDQPARGMSPCRHPRFSADRTQVMNECSRGTTSSDLDQIKWQACVYPADPSRLVRCTITTSLHSLYVTPRIPSLRRRSTDGH